MKPVTQCKQGRTIMEPCPADADCNQCHINEPVTDAPEGADFRHARLSLHIRNLSGRQARIALHAILDNPGLPLSETIGIALTYTGQS